MTNLYKWKHFSEEIIIQVVYWYLKYSLSYRDITELLSERGFNICSTTIYRWVIEYAPAIESRIKKKANQALGFKSFESADITIKGKLCI